MSSAAIIGSGPNGLAAAIRLAQAGHQVRVYEAQPTIGGGTRSADLTLPGYLHDICSAVHPFAVLSPFFRSLPIEEHGLEWIHPAVLLAHPLDDGSAVAVTASLAETARDLGEDRAAYETLFGNLAQHLPLLADDVLAPILHVPRHPLLLARFGMRALLSAKVVASRELATARARALFAGLAAHSFLALDAPFTAAFALLLGASAHAGGWPIPRGGAQRIADALVSILRAHGGEVHPGTRVESLPNADSVLFDTSPAALERIARSRLPARYRDKLRRFPRGPGVFKIDYALSAPVPWRAEPCRRAGTVHLGGRFEEIAASEEAIARGVHAEKPFVLVTQPSLFDETRAPPGAHTLWAYCHVPNGSLVDMTARIEAQIERFAPGFRDVVLARHTMSTREVEAHNANYLGGDISGGTSDPLALLSCVTPAKGIYLCSASTAPGAGVHGMCGLHAAEEALRRTGGTTTFRRARTHHAPDARRSAQVVNR